MSIFDSKALQNDQPSGLDALQRLSEGMIDGTEQLARLQLQTLRDVSDGFFASWSRMLSVSGPEAVAELSPAVQAQRMLECGRQAQELATAGQKIFLGLLRQQMDAGATQVRGMVAELAKNAPADAEPLVDAMQAAAKGGDCFYGNSWKAAGEGMKLADNVIRLSREAGRVASGARKPQG